MKSLKENQVERKAITSKLSLVHVEAIKEGRRRTKDE
jgi:hypothetical protein